MKRLAAFLWILVFWAAGQSALAQPAPASAFAELPSLGFTALSPDGQMLAYSDSQGANHFILATNLQTGERRPFLADRVRVEGLQWVGNTHVVVRAGRPRNIAIVRGVVDYAELIALDIQTGQMRHLVRRTRNMGFNPDLAQIRAVDHEQGRVMIEVRSTSFTADLYWVDVRTGSYSRHESGTVQTVGWVIGPQRETVARVERRDGEGLTVLLRQGNRMVTLERDSELPNLMAVYGLDSTGENLIARQSRRGVASSVVAIALDGSGKEEELFSDPTHEVSGVVIESYTNAVMGIEWADDYVRTQWFDEGFGEIHQVLGQSIQADTIRIEAWSQDRSVALVEAAYSDRPTDYFIFRNHPETGMRLEGPLSTNATVAATYLPARLPMTYRARDDVSIPGYLTVPDGPGPHPFVILPHGGPAARDYGGYDYFAHFIASRGYGVMQPNFRGSAGYGTVWRTSGHGEWGTGMMQNDVTDAVQALIAAGIADPNRICIAGASYGGYAALAGAAFTPDLYRCAISINGVGSLQRMMNYARDRFGRASGPHAYWQTAMIGNFDGNERNYLRDRSPEDNAASIRAAVLLLHGIDDSVVPVEQSRRMETALRRQGAHVRYVEQRGGDHWLTSYEIRREVLEEIEAFLAEHLSP